MSETIERRDLHLALYRAWLSDSAAWWDTIMSNVKWYRVKYRSGRFDRQCETPCWTAFYGGFPCFSPYAPVPEWLQPLVDRVSAQLGGARFNAILVRLYFDGADEIAWHTDGRTFLGSEPTIASLSLGAAATFEMRRMLDVWPTPGSGGDGIDHATPIRSFVLSDADLLVMRGPTQQHWHHRVPKARSRRPRININFRYIVPGTPDAERGQQVQRRDSNRTCDHEQPCTRHPDRCAVVRRSFDRRTTSTWCTATRRRRRRGRTSSCSAAQARSSPSRAAQAPLSRRLRCPRPRRRRPPRHPP